MRSIFISNTATPETQKVIFGTLAAMVIAAGLFLASVQPGVIYTDGSIFASVAMKDLGAGILYADAWENKPPGVFYLTELFLLLIPDGVYAVFVMNLVVCLLSAALLFLLIHERLGKLFASLTLSAAGIFFMVHRNNIGDGMYTESQGTLLILSSLYFLVHEKEKRRFPFSALMAGTSFWFKEPFILMCLPLAGLYIGRHRNAGSALKYLAVMMIPSLIFLSVMYIRGSLPGFIGMLQYNFSYAVTDRGIAPLVKINDLYRNLILPSAGLSILFAVLLYRALSDTKTRQEAIWRILLLLSSLAPLFMSPYNFGHYYIPVFTVFYTVLADLCGLYEKSLGRSFRWPVFLLSLYTLFRIDSVDENKWKLSVEPYRPDPIAEFLSREKGSSLFVDYVVKADYYIKTGLPYPTFVPVAIPVHFGDSETGKRNRKRIWTELKNNPPDYLITTYTNSYFSWFFPEHDFYNRNYFKKDSIVKENENIIYLWKRREAPPAP